MTAVSCGCGCLDVFAVRPGYEGARRGAVDLFTRLDPIVDRPVPDEVWCKPCWLRAFTRAEVSIQ